MKTAILNIGCSPPTFDRVSQAPELANEYRRARAALSGVAQEFRSAYFELHKTPAEAVIVATVPYTNLADFEALVHELAVMVNQDCIAIWYPEARVGRLVGHRAADWAPFDPLKFIMPDRRISL